ncbi:hypothetical protein BJV82DRAFT_151687 [Fennellomyces sp. T-0311]|nr:hypothetical protein BJV82DRAFT_151687 [Fennellomyces sp. T-0311]
MSKGTTPPVAIKVEDTGIKPFPRRNNEIRSTATKLASIELPKKKETSSTPPFADTKPFTVPKRLQHEGLRFKSPECPPALQARRAGLFKRNDREENPLSEYAVTGYRPDTPRYKQEPAFEYDCKLSGHLHLPEASCSTIQDGGAPVYPLPTAFDAPSCNPFDEHHENAYDRKHRHALSAPSSQQQQPSRPSIAIRKNEPSDIDDDYIDQLVKACKEKLTTSNRAHAIATDQIQSLETTVNAQQRTIQESEARSNDMSRWIQTMMSRQHRFDQTVMSLRGRYDAFHSVMKDLEKLAQTSNETKVANAKAFEEFEQHYCNTLRDQLHVLEHQTEDMHSSFASLRSEQQSMKELTLSLSEECGAYRLTLGECQAQCQLHLTMVDDLKEGTRQVHQGLENWSVMSNQLKNEIAANKFAYQELEEKWTSMKSIISEIENALNDSVAKSSGRDNTVDAQATLADVADKHTETCKLYEQTISDLEVELKSTKKDFERTKSRYENEVQGLKNENNALMRHSSALAEELSREKERCKRLEDEAEKRQRIVPAAKPYPISSQGSTGTTGSQTKASTTRNKRSNLETCEHPLPKCSTISMTLRSSSMPRTKQIKQEKSDDDLQLEEPLKKRRKRTLIRKRPPPEKAISVHSDDDPEKEIQALIASVDPYKTTNDSGSSGKK